MSENQQQLAPQDYKSGVRPVWCAGCGNYGVMTALLQALAELQINPDEFLVSSGIGCASRFPYFLKAYALHGVHGRAIPVGIGMKTARPDLPVVVIGGDGDGFSIGCGHLPHISRKNVDITYIVCNNAIYGLTKGQTSPTSWTGQRTSTSPMGVVDPPLKPMMLLLGVGATFVARGFAAKPKELKTLITSAIQHRGFSVVEVLSVCPSFNRDMGFKELNEMLIQIPEEHDTSDRAAAMGLAMDKEGLYQGVFYQEAARTYNDNKRIVAEISGHFDDKKSGLKQIFDGFA